MNELFQQNIARNNDLVALPEQYLWLSYLFYLQRHKRIEFTNVLTLVDRVNRKGLTAENPMVFGVRGSRQVYGRSRLLRGS